MSDRSSNITSQRKAVLYVRQSSVHPSYTTVRAGACNMRCASGSQF